MNYLNFEHITKKFGEKTLFEDLAISISQGDKAAIVARNGSGKSSLIRIIAGIDSPDGDLANMYINKAIRIGYLSQDPDFDPDDNLLDAILNSNEAWMTPLKALYHAQHTHDPKEIEKALSQMDEHHAWEMDATMRELCGKFQLPGFDFKVKNLSGGQKKRLAMVQVLCVKPEFLILDEPTNHLDLEMIEWLEKYLENSQITLLMVTHDRYFLNNVCNQIYELDRGVLYKYQGDYESFLEKKAIRMQKARTTKNKARVDRFYDLKESLVGPKEAGTIEFEIEQPRLGTKVLELHHICKSYGDKWIVKNFSYKFKPTDRIGIIGPNGSGKTSLLKLFTGSSKVDQGKIILGETVQFGYYQQDGLQILDDKRVIDVIRDIADYIPLKKGHKLSAEALLERFLFPRPQQQVYISQLSGGEKRRLYLLTILISNPNFLILDEPTNDLDIITLNVLEDYLQDFPGCVLVVSHDRYFMDKIVEHIFVLKEEGSIEDFPGNYTSYRNLQETVKEQEQASKNSEIIKDPTAKERRPGQQEKKELLKIEKELEKLLTERELLVAKFSDGSIQMDQMSEVNKRLTEIQELIRQKESRWMELVDAGA